MVLQHSFPANFLWTRMLCSVYGRGLAERGQGGTHTEMVVVNSLIFERKNRGGNCQRLGRRAATGSLPMAVGLRVPVTGNLEGHLRASAAERSQPADLYPPPGPGPGTTELSPVLWHAGGRCCSRRRTQARRRELPFGQQQRRRGGGQDTSRCDSRAETN